MSGLSLGTGAIKMFGDPISRCSKAFLIVSKSLPSKDQYFETVVENTDMGWDDN